jgi:prepilin-type N-terminal cleavage/methylation domain-containing protein
MAPTASQGARSLASRRATEPGGFTLLEMVVALAIMGLLGALALPSLQKLTERTGFSLDRQDVERQLDQLPQIAASQGKALVLTSSPTNDDPVPAGASLQEPYPVKLPEGWVIEVAAPIRYRYDGTCSGGRLHLTTPSSQSDYLMRPPLCELRPG